MADRIAYLRLNPEALRYFPEMNYTLNGVPGRGMVTLTAREPVLTDKDGACLGVPESYVRASALHEEMVEPRDEDGALINRIHRFKIAPSPFAVPKLPQSAHKDVFNAAGDEGNAEEPSLFNSDGDAEQGDADAAAAEAPRTSAAPAGNAARNGAPGSKRNRTSGAPDPAALP